MPEVALLWSFDLGFATIRRTGHINLIGVARGGAENFLTYITVTDTTFTVIMNQSPEPDSLLPLTPTVFNILVALVDGEKHGYAIMQAVATETGASPMGPGTLYGTLDRMLRDRLISESDGSGETSAHSERRRYYRITDFGDRVLRAEVRRLQELVNLARRKKLLPRHGVRGV